MNQQWRRVLGHRTIVISLSLLILAGGFGLWSFAEGERKYGRDEIPAGVETTDVVVEFDFKLEQFHMQIMQDTGNILRVEGGKVFLRNADVGRLRAIARRYWIRDIRPIEAADDSG